MLLKTMLLNLDEILNLKLILDIEIYSSSDHVQKTELFSTGDHLSEIIEERQNQYLVIFNLLNISTIIQIKLI